MIKVRKFKKEGSLIVRDTDGRLLTFLKDDVHEMTELFFQRPLGISLLRDNELEFCNPEVFKELQVKETAEAPEAQVVEDTEPQEQEQIQVESNEEVLAEEKPIKSNKKKKEVGG